MPSSPLRKTLRGAGHPLPPVVQIGKLGTTEAVLAQIKRAVLDHELVKIRVGTECPGDRFETAEILAEQSGAQVAQILGRTILLYKRHPKKPRFEKPDKARTTDAPRKPARPSRPKHRVIGRRKSRKP